MEDMRSEIRAAFEKEQRLHPPAAGMRQAIAAAVASPQRRQTNLQWAAVAAAVVLALLVVAGLMATRIGHRTSIQAHNPPVADYGPPPTGVALVYVHDPKHAGWLIGYDWQGRPRGTVKLAKSVDAAAVGMAPDGQSFSAMVGSKGGGTLFLDRLGREISAGQMAVDREVWADDNRHLCGMSLDNQTFLWTLVWQAAGEQRHSIDIVRDSGVGQTGLAVASCSVKNDRAIVVRTSVAWPSELWLVRLSDGKLVHHTYTMSTLSGIVSSRDTLYIAENATIETQSPTRSSILTQIRRVSDWQVATTLPQGERVLGFSGDDSLVLVAMSSGTDHEAVLALASGSMIWRETSTKGLTGFVAEPNGSSFALAVTDCCSGAPQNPVVGDVFIVHGDGTTTTIPGRYLPAW